MSSDSDVNNLPLESANVSTVAMALLFSTIFFTTVSLGVRSFLAGDARALKAAWDPRAKPLDMKSFASVFALFYHWSVFGLILLLTYICEYHPPHPHGDKAYDRDEFLFMTAILFVASAFTVHKNDKEKEKPKPAAETHHKSIFNGTDKTGADVESGVENKLAHRKTNEVRKIHTVAPVKAANDVLNRDQTEEWKGWMQYMFLLYHYYHAEEVYNSVRIMITCYVWMTGFGNLSFFYLKADYSLLRVLQMLWRLNFLVLFLCMTQGTTYILYYICPLHTYFFFMVYFTMRTGKHLNYSKYGLRAKLAVVALIIYVVWDCNFGLFELIHGLFLKEVPQMGATGGSMWEWYFRSTLDHWSTFLGMVFAVNFPIVSLFYRKLEAKPFVQHFIGKAAIGLGFSFAFYLWVTGPWSQPKLVYNQTNCYFGFIPMITYIYFRNLTPTLRSYSLNLLHEIGKSTLETYLMQHHIWLTSDAKSLLILIPGWHKCNALVVTLMYFYVSRRLYKLTLYLRSMHLPDDLNKCIQSLVAIVCVVAVFYAIALSLTSFGMTSLMPIALVSVPCGFLLYQTILDSTWTTFRDSSKSSDIESESFFDSLFSSEKGSKESKSSSSNGEIVKPNIVIESDTQISRLTPPVIGAMAIMILGTVWTGLAANGGGKILPLPDTCSAHANVGSWIPINPCNEEQKGLALRDYDISSMACTNPSADVHSFSGTFAWGWNTTEVNSQCRFAYRDAKSVKSQIRTRTVSFVGDSMTRNLFFAALRSLGVPNAGGYDATIPKHSDIKQMVGDTTVEFRWAPLAQDTLDVMKDYNSASKSDIIIAGGGAWDRLHLWATDEDQASHKATVQDLAREISTSGSSGVPVVWHVPNTINTPALNHEDKRDHMKEEDMEEMRKFFESQGIYASASFVLDGPAYTRDRVLESYDGIHYPPQVYGAGVQILFNAFDWLLDPDDLPPADFTPKKPGSMANPYLGLMMLCFAFIGLMFFDAFMGFSYLACFFVSGVMPSDLYEEAYVELHEKNGLPLIFTSSRKKPTVDNMNMEKDEDNEFNLLLSNSNGN